MMVMTYGCAGTGDVEAKNLTTGAMAWSRPDTWTFQRGDLSGSAGKHLYARNTSGTVVALNPLTGQKQYSLSNAVKVLVVDASRVYATCGSQGQYVCAYNISTGAFEWQNTRFGSPALAAEADGVLYLDSGVALNAATGQRIKTAPFISGSTAKALAVGDGRIATVSGSDRILDLYGLHGY